MCYVSTSTFKRVYLNLLLNIYKNGNYSFFGSLTDLGNNIETTIPTKVKIEVKTKVK